MRKILIFTMIIMLLMNSSVFASSFDKIISAEKLNEEAQPKSNFGTMRGLAEWGGYMIGISLLDTNILRKCGCILYYMGMFDIFSFDILLMYKIISVEYL